MSEDTDQQLVDRVLSGNKNAFNLLVLRYQHRVLALVGRFIHDSHEAEDVCQEAFIKAYRALPLFRGDSAFATPEKRAGWISKTGMPHARPLTPYC
jgi:RNA polymerase sigma-70 factor (ECF subfamily)